MSTLEKKLNRLVIRRLNKECHKALYAYLKKEHNDEKEYQDFKMKLEAWKEALNE